jgi:hypothetical protein
VTIIEVFEDPCSKLRGIFDHKECGLFVDSLAYPAAPMSGICAWLRRATGIALDVAVQRQRRHTMTKSGKVLAASYGVVASILMALAFAGLFSQKMGFRIPIISTDIIPALHRHAVWGETLKGRAILLGGGEWFFLIVLGVVILLGILTAIVNKLIQSAEK